MAGRVGTMLSTLVQLDGLLLSPDGKRLALNGLSDGQIRPHVLSTEDGSELMPADGTDGMRLLGWLDGDNLLFEKDNSLQRCRYDGTGSSVVEDYPAGHRYTLGPWSLSPDGSKIAVGRDDSAAIDILDVGGSGVVKQLGGLPGVVDGQAPDCSVPIWLPTGTLIGMCKGTDELYVAVEGDAGVTMIDPGLDGDIWGIVRWGGDDQVLVDFMSINADDVRRLQVFDSSGTQLRQLFWLQDDVMGRSNSQHMRISKDERVGTINAAPQASRGDG